MTIEKAPENKCPRCSTGILEVRLRRHDRKPFFGCSNYPRCRYTKDAPAGTAPTLRRFRPLRTPPPVENIPASVGNGPFMTIAALVTGLVAAMVWVVLIGSWNNFISHALGFCISTWALMSVTQGHWKVICVLVLIALVAAITFQNHYENTTMFTWRDRIGAIDMDGTRSYSTGRGTGSHHGGVREWLYQEYHRPMSHNERWATALSDYWWLTPFIATVPAALINGILVVLAQRKVSAKESFAKDK